MKDQPKARRLKVSYFINYPYCAPAIPVKGRWLERAGFNIGDYVNIEVGAGRLVITIDPESERTALAKKIKAVTGELRRLKEREATYCNNFGQRERGRKKDIQ